MSEPTTAPSVVIEWKPSGRNGTLLIAAVVDGQAMFSDKLDPSRASARKRFAEAIAAKVPGMGIEDVDAELLRIATEAGASRTLPDADQEIIVARPELGFRPEVSWLATPSVSMGESGPVGRWFLHLQWADGRRERKSLEKGIELPDGRRLWFEPQPSPPALTQASGWSADGRTAWLSGEPAENLAALFRGLSERFAYYLDFAPDWAAGTAATLALWTLLSYVYPAWSAVPYLSIGGPMGSGKSRVFEVLSRLVFRPMPSANVTAPAMFRSLHDTGGVLLLDEAERLKDGAPDAGELRSILLSGYKAGTPAKRLESTGDGKFQTRTFDVFGPKALAAIGNLPEALASRCIRIVMFRATPDSPKPRRRIDEDPDLWARLRDGLHVMALEHRATWPALAARDDVCPTMSGRDFELWQPLLALASWIEENGADGLLGMMQGHAARTIEAARDDSIPDGDEILLHLLAESVVAGMASSVGPAELLKRAQEREPNLFNRWTARGVGSSLRRYGIEPNTIRGKRWYGRVGVGQLVRIERSYGLDLGLGDDVRRMGGG